MDSFVMVKLSTSTLSPEELGACWDEINASLPKLVTLFGTAKSSWEGQHFQQGLFRVARDEPWKSVSDFFRQWNKPQSVDVNLTFFKPLWEKFPALLTQYFLSVTASFSSFL